MFMRDDLVLNAGPDARRTCRAGNSFKQIEIIMASEEEWNIRFTTRELDGLRCVGDLVRTIAAKTGGG